MLTTSSEFSPSATMLELPQDLPQETCLIVSEETPITEDGTCSRA
jgi:hypothetical protein